MKAISVFSILNILCGFIQIIIVFLIPPSSFGYLTMGYFLYVFLIGLGFITGYRNTFGDVFKQEGRESIYAGILFLTNLAFFLLITVWFFDDPTNTLNLSFIVTAMLIATISNFNELGKVLRRHQNG